jgi:hypothetical protein
MSNFADVESFNDALIECVKAAGGSKEVCSVLWPEKPLNEAQRLLLNCLNGDRPEKLSPDQAVLVMKMAKVKGSHIGIEFLCLQMGYTIPKPISKEDEKAELMRQFIEAKNMLVEISKKLEG